MLVVTASTDSLDFVGPIRVGDIIEVVAYVTWTHNSSMEVFVKVQSEQIGTGEKTTAVTAFFSFVGLNEEGKPTRVPKVIPQTDEEVRLHASAPARYELRMKRKQERAENRGS